MKRRPLFLSGFPLLFSLKRKATVGGSGLKLLRFMALSSSLFGLKMTEYWLWAAAAVAAAAAGEEGQGTLAEGHGVLQARVAFIGPCSSWLRSHPLHLSLVRSRFLGRGSDEALFSEKKGVFSEKGGGMQWMRRLVRISTGKAIQWRGPGHSVNRRTPKIEKLLSKSPSQKSAPINSVPLKRDWRYCFVRCSKLEPFCETGKWAHLANLGWNDPNAHAKIKKIRQNSPNFRRNSPNFSQNSPISQTAFHKRALTLNTQISCDAPYSAIGFRGKLFLRYPPA